MGQENTNTKAILVGICLDQKDRTERLNSLDELERLTSTLGVETIEKHLQNRKQIDKTWFLGKGFLENISLRMKEKEADLLAAANTKSELLEEQHALQIKLLQLEQTLEELSDNKHSLQAQVQEHQQTIEQSQSVCEQLKHDLEAQQQDHDQKMETAIRENNILKIRDTGCQRYTLYSNPICGSGRFFSR